MRDWWRFVVVMAIVAAGGWRLAAGAPRLADGGQQAADPLSSLRDTWRTPPPDARPMMRWWWFGPAVDPDGLTAELTRMRDAGLGGVEVQPVYPVVLDDAAAGIVNAPYLSPAFLKLLRHSADTAHALGLRFDLTLGSGWPYGGPHIPITRAAGRLRWERVPVRGRRVPLPAMGAGESLIAITLPDGRRELTDLRDGAVWMPDGVQASEIWVFIASRTGMMVKRAAVGAEGFVLDHYDRRALQAHLDAVGTPQLDALRGRTPQTLFCDSLEVFASDWTEDLLDEFRRRRGYDLRLHLGTIVAGTGATAAAVRHDWARTLGELYVERFLTPLAEWTRARGSKLRIQGYGIPPATLASNRLADLTDGEGWHWRTITASRWAASANHLFDRRVTASETWTWLHSPSFRATPLNLKAEADRHFLQGINQIIGHGWPSTPGAVEGPGWRFYAAGAFNDRNPWFIAMPEIARYLHRVSAVLREGQPVTDVALYLPTSDALGDVTPGRGHLLDLLRERVGTAVPGAILASGAQFDLVDDGAIEQAGRVDGAVLVVGAQRFRAVVLPAVETMPLRTLRVLDTFAKAGGAVIATGRAPTGLPGLLVPEAEPLEFTAIAARLFGTSGPARVSSVESLAATLALAFTPDVSLSPVAPDVGAYHRRGEAYDLYFVANTRNEPYAGDLGVRAIGAAEWWDPLTGETRGADLRRVTSDTMTVSLELPAYGSSVLVVSRGTAVQRVRRPSPASGTTVATITPGPWTVSFPEGVRRASPLALPGSWNQDEGTRFYSGVATYEAAFELPARPGRGARVLLDFGEGTPVPEIASKGPGMRAWLDGPVRDAAVVWVNGVRAGAVWSPPWQLAITPHVRPGPNTLRIAVGNTAMNAIAGRPQPDDKLLVLRYGDRFQPQDMDQVRPLPSGLLSPVEIQILPARP